MITFLCSVFFILILSVVGWVDKGTLNDTFELHLKDFSFAHKQFALVDITTGSTFHDNLAATRSICMLYFERISYHPSNFEILRCQVPMLHTMRLRKLTALHTLFPFQYMYPVSQGELWGLMSQLSFLNSPTYQREDDHVCFFSDLEGYFNVSHAVGLLGTFPSVTKISLYAVARTNDALFRSVLGSFSEDAIEQLMFILNVKFHKEHIFVDIPPQKPTRGTCDYIIICSHTFIAIPDRQIRQVMETYLTPSEPLNSLRNEQQQPVHPYNILWLTTDFENLDVDSIFEWQLSTTWTQISTFHSVVDSGGFSAKTYDYHRARTSPSSVVLGRYRWPSSVSESCETKNKEGSEISMVEKDDLVIIITYTIRVFAESAYGLQRQLKQHLLYPHVFVLVEVTSDALVALEEALQSSHCDEGCCTSSKPTFLQIALGPHDITTLLPRGHYIAYHMEQSWSDFLMFIPRAYLQVLRDAVDVWVFSETQRQFFHGNSSNQVEEITVAKGDGFQGRRPLTDSFLTDMKDKAVHVLPMYIYLDHDSGSFHDLHAQLLNFTLEDLKHDGYNALSARQFLARSNEEDVQLRNRSSLFRILGEGNSLKVLFYGSCSQRRITMLEELRTRFTDYNDALLASEVSSASGNDQGRRPWLLVGFCGGWNMTLFDNARDWYVHHAHVVLNIHTQAGSVLEVHRINYLLGRGVCIISERGSDPLLTARYASALMFFDGLEEAMQLLHTLLADTPAAHDALYRCRQRSLGLFADLDADTEPLRIAMDHARQKLLKQTL